MKKDNKNGQGENPALEPLIIPCQCGSDQANWIGDKCGLRAYLCPDCAAHELNVTKGEESPVQFMLSALLVAETTLSAYGEYSPALAVIREAIARATIEERL
jgi:hypothetical protein